MKQTLKEWLRKIRYKIAYFIAPDWIDDLENRFSVFLCEQTGSRLSKCYYSIETMRSVANDYQQRLCDECKSEFALEIIGYLKKHLKLKRKMIDFPATCRDTKNYQCGAFDILNYFDEVADSIEKEYTEGEQ